jgi:FkbM family methyltransferase
MLSYNEMVRADKIPNINKSLKRIKSLGITPRVIYDVGAYEGEFSDVCLEIFPEAKLYLFEANQAKIDVLKSRFKNSNVEINNVALGDQNKDGIDFFVDETASSILPSFDLLQKKETIKTKMITLDSFVLDEFNECPNILKIDTQGFDYYVLLGSKQVLKNIDIVIVETNFIEVYEGSVLFFELMSLLNEFDFTVYDITEIHRRGLDNALFQIDFLFVKKDSDLRRSNAWG